MKLSILKHREFLAAILLGQIAASTVLAQTTTYNSTGQSKAASSTAGGNHGTVAQSSGINPGNNPAQEQVSAGDPTYLISPQDVVEVRVFQEDDLLTTVRVAQDGTIKFPLIGSVKVANKTEDGAARTIAAELAKDYIINPQVTVKAVEYAQRRYTVLGEVGKPGTYSMPDRASITVFEAVGNAGGFTHLANLGSIELKRVVDGKETVFRLSAKTGDRRTSTFEIKSGDIITIGQSIF